MASRMKRMSKPSSPRKSVDLRGSSLFKNTLLNLVGLIIPYLVGFASIPFVIRWLGVDRFGVLSLVWVVFGYFGLFDLGLGRTTTKYIAEALGNKEHEKLPRYLWTTVYIQLMVGLAGMVLLIALAHFLSHSLLRIPAQFQAETQATLVLVAFSLPVMFIASSFRGVLEASQRFDLVNVVKIPVNIMFYILPLIGAMAGLDLRGIVVLLVASRVLGLVAWLLLSLKVHPELKAKPVFQRNLVRSLFSFSSWLALSGILYTVLSSVDKLLIGARISVKAVSYYSAPYEAILRLGVIPGSFAMVLFPAFSFLTAAGQHEKTEKLFCRSVRYLLISTGPVLLLVIFFAGPLLRLWLGQEFAVNSARVVQFLALGFLVNCVSTVAYNYLQGIGRVDLTTKYQVAELVVFSIMLWFFIKFWGINGAAVAAMVRFIAFTFFLFSAAFKTAHLSFANFLKGGILRTAAGLGLFASGLLACRVFHLGLVGPLVLVIAFLPAIYFLLLDAQEREFFRTKTFGLLSVNKSRSR